MARSLADQLKVTQQRIELSKRWREHEGYDKTWDRLTDLYGLKPFDKLSPQDQIAVHIAFATINVIHPSVSVSHPKITLWARKADEDDKAAIAEAMMDYWLKRVDYGITPQFQRAVKDFLVIGHGWLKTGYKYVEHAEPKAPEEMEAEFASKVQFLEEQASADPYAADQMPTDDEIWATIPETSIYVDEDHPFVERVSPHDIYVDPQATSMQDLCWIAQKMDVPYEEAQNDERYSAAGRKALKHSGSMAAVGDDHGDRNKELKNDPAHKYVTIWEFYDIKKNTISVFGDGAKEWLIKPTKMPYALGHPFIMLRNYDVPDQFYPIGDLEAVEPLQAELNKQRTQMMRARATYARKILIQESVLDNEAVDALTSDQDNQLVVVRNNQVPLNQAVQPLPTPTIPPDFFQYSTDIEQQIANVSGVSEYQRGASPEIRRTATEASMIQDAVNARSAQKLAIIEAGIAHMGHNLLELARQFLTGTQTARIIGAAGEPIWVEFTQDDIDVDADFDIEGGSTMPKNEAWRQKQVADMLNAIGPLIGTVIDPAAVATFALRQFGVKSPESFIMQQDPMAMMPQDPNAPQAPPGGDPNALPPEISPVSDETPDKESQNPQAPPGGGQIPPHLLNQLQGQVGLNLG